MKCATGFYTADDLFQQYELNVATDVKYSKKVHRVPEGNNITLIAKIA